MSVPKSSTLVTDILDYLETQNTAGKFTTGLRGLGEWTHRGLIADAPYVEVTVTAEGGEDGDPQDVEASLMIKVITWGGAPNVLAPELRLLANEIRQQIDLHDGRWGGPHLYWQNTRYQGWFEGNEGEESPEARAYITYRAAYKENIE